MSKKRWDLVVSSKDRNDKNRYTKVGVIFENDKGQLSVLVDKGVSISCPEGVYINGYEPKAKEQGASAQHRDDFGDLPY